MRVSDPRLQVAVVAPRNEVLRRPGIRECESLDVKVELQRRGRLAGEPAHGDQDGRRVAGFIAASYGWQHFIREGRSGGQQGEQTANVEWVLHAAPRLVFILKGIMYVRCLSLAPSGKGRLTVVILSSALCTDASTARSPARLVIRLAITVPLLAIVTLTSTVASGMEASSGLTQALSYTLHTQAA